MSFLETRKWSGNGWNLGSSLLSRTDGRRSIHYRSMSRRNVIQICPILMTLANPGNSVLRSSLPEYVALLVYLGLFRSHFREQVNVVEYESDAFQDGSWNFEAEICALRFSKPSALELSWHMLLLEDVIHNHTLTRYSHWGLSHSPA